jgi:hypothetical protein
MWAYRPYLTNVVYKCSVCIRRFVASDEAGVDVRKRRRASTGSSNLDAASDTREADLADDLKRHHTEAGLSQRRRKRVANAVSEHTASTRFLH